MTFRPVSGFGGKRYLKTLAALIALLALGLLAGCNGEDAEAEVTVDSPPAIAFEGQIDPAYAGTWITADKTSTMVLSSDGKAEMTNVALGRGSTTAKGQWKVSDKYLLFQVEGSKTYVSRYDAELKEDSLRLKKKASKLDVEYKRSK